MTGADRHQAREAALQALYFAEVGRSDPDVALETVFTEHRPEAAADVRALAGTLARGAAADQVALDAVIARHSAHWRVERLAVVDRLVLRLAVWELRERPETPPAVVLNEAIELARAFGGDDSARFVNGVLDAIRRELGGERET